MQQRQIWQNFSAQGVYLVLNLYSKYWPYVSQGTKLLTQIILIRSFHPGKRVIQMDH